MTQNAPHRIANTPTINIVEFQSERPNIINIAKVLKWLILNFEDIYKKSLLIYSYFKKRKLFNRNAFY